ncbi:hypothetical protein NE626_16245, partial [Intestinimonas massiliensis]|nr:hypothetical protein [Intestinimonas massiliensis (ex Afouda et al. 2020)]
GDTHQRALGDGQLGDLGLGSNPVLGHQLRGGGGVSLVCITGKVDMADAIQGYFEVLSAANPDALRGSIPDDGFYFE